jgi:hypothetical protein
LHWHAWEFVCALNSNLNFKIRVDLGLRIKQKIKIVNKKEKPHSPAPWAESTHWSSSPHPAALARPNTLTLRAAQLVHIPRVSALRPHGVTATSGPCFSQLARVGRSPHSLTLGPGASLLQPRSRVIVTAARWDPPVIPYLPHRGERRTRIREAHNCHT